MQPASLESQLQKYDSELERGERCPGGPAPGSGARSLRTIVIHMFDGPHSARGHDRGRPGNRG